MFTPRAVLLVNLLFCATVAAFNLPGQQCNRCHLATVTSYERSQMANAAIGQEFLKHWKNDDQSEKCLLCHSPSNTRGIICQDCHSGDGHQQGLADEVSVCARCHDAPGENTVRSYRKSMASMQGLVCTSCHLDFKNTGHEFLGPSTPGFMTDVVNLKLSLRKQQNELNVIIQIRHKAGHSLPGGTIGRSVWLKIDAFDRYCRVIESSQVRFGWLKTQHGDMIDNSLLAAKTKMIEIPILDREKTAGIDARMIYRFAPGAIDLMDEREILLEQKSYILSQSLMNCVDLNEGVKFIK